jgi:hypothetical protein
MEDLQFHAIPALDASWNSPNETDITQLNLMAGQLYLEDYAAYETLCRTLGITSGNVEKRDGLGAWDGDGFVRVGDRDPEMAKSCTFQKGPIRFIKTLISLRRKGIDYRAAHMGRILSREGLTVEDFSPNTEEVEEDGEEGKDEKEESDESNSVVSLD